MIYMKHYKHAERTLKSEKRHLLRRIAKLAKRITRRDAKTERLHERLSNMRVDLVNLC